MQTIIVILVLNTIQLLITLHSVFEKNNVWIEIDLSFKNEAFSPADLNARKHLQLPPYKLANLREKCIGSSRILNANNIYIAAVDCAQEIFVRTLIASSELRSEKRR